MQKVAPNNSAPGDQRTLGHRRISFANVNGCCNYCFFVTCVDVHPSSFDDGDSRFQTRSRCDFPYSNTLHELNFRLSCGFHSSRVQWSPRCVIAEDVNLLWAVPPLVFLVSSGVATIASSSTSLSLDTFGTLPTACCWAGRQPLRRLLLAGQMIVSLSPSLPRREVGLVISPIVSEPLSMSGLQSLSSQTTWQQQALLGQLALQLATIGQEIGHQLAFDVAAVVVAFPLALADRFACASGLESLGSYQQSHSVGSPVKRPPQHQHPWNWTPLVS